MLKKYPNEVKLNAELEKESMFTIYQYLLKNIFYVLWQK